jgi:amino acid adenylation domain-containing protein
MTKDSKQKVKEGTLQYSDLHYGVPSKWNETEQPFPIDLTVEKLFELQAAKTPDAPAFIMEDVVWTYGDLNYRANYLARRLNSLGVEPGETVGLFFERSFEYLVALFAVLKTGAAFVPLDPDYPDQRLIYICNDAGLKQVLSQTSLEKRVSVWNAQCLFVDKFNWFQVSRSQKPFLSRSSANSLIYIMYTSGSSGLPKGVKIQQFGVMNLLHWLQSEYGMASTARVLHKTSISFDVSISEMFWPLVNGASLVLARPGGQRDASYLVRVIKDQGVTQLLTGPSMLRAMLDVPQFQNCSTLKVVYITGEAHTVEVNDKFHNMLNVDLHNLYGPTETTVFSSYWQCAKDAKIISIGKPVANTKIYLLDPSGQAAPLGCPGEIYIGGAGLALGYQNLPDRTSESFIKNPLQEGKSDRLYRTGDLAKFHSDGTLEYLGRKDQQIQLRGVRIEPGEIESLLNKRSDIRGSAVVVIEHGPGDSRLHAFFVPVSEEDSPDQEELRAYLRTQLPETMVPSVLTERVELPHTVSGKLDRKLLIQDKINRAVPTAKRSLDGESHASKIATIFSEILELESVNEDDSFFELGGHSLLAIKITNRIRSEFDVELSFGAVFSFPTPSQLARNVHQIKNSKSK